MGQGVLLSAGADIDFMVHGVFSYEIFGHTAWITTTHICVLIVMLVLIAFSIIAGRTMKKAEEVPKQSQWSYPPEEISYLLEQIEEGDRENGCEFLYYQGRLYEKEETKEW